MQHTPPQLRLWHFNFYLSMRHVDRIHISISNLSLFVANRVALISYAESALLCRVKHLLGAFISGNLCSFVSIKIWIKFWIRMSATNLHWKVKRKTCFSLSSPITKTKYWMIDSGAIESSRQKYSHVFTLTHLPVAARCFQISIFLIFHWAKSHCEQTNAVETQQS